MSSDLDTRARAAAEGVRRSAAGIEVPPWKGDRRRAVLGGRSVWWLAAAALVVFGVAAVLLARDDSERVATDPGGVPVLIPEVLPEGLELSGGVDLPLELDDESAWSLAVEVYGAVATDTPVVGVTIFHGSGPQPPYEGREITVRDRAGTAVPDDEGRSPGVAWLEADGVLVTVTSDTLAESEILAIAEGLSFGDGHRTVEASVLPAGVVPIASMPDASYVSFAVPVPLPRAAGHVVGFQSEEGVLAVATLAGGRDDLIAIRWLLGGTPQPIQVRGHPAFLLPSRAPALRTVLWEESPGVVVVLSATLSEEALLAAAESLRPATAREWATTKAMGRDGDSDGDSGGSNEGRMTPPTAAPPPSDSDGDSGGSNEGATTTLGERPTALAEGVASDGSTWRLTTGGDLDSGPSLCFEIESESSGSGSCGSFGGGPGLHEDDQFPHFVFGQVPPPGTTVVRVILVGGSGVSEPVVDRSFYAVELPAGTEPAEVVFLDANGAEVGRSPLNE